METLERMRASLNSASALESFVDSPGRVGWKPCSFTFSSSTSAGSSVSMSSSLSSFGSPRDIAAKLDCVSYRITEQKELNSRIKSIQ